MVRTGERLRRFCRPESMEAPSLNFAGIQIANRILTYFYLDLAIACFCLFLGNRLQGSKIFYTTALVGFRGDHGAHACCRTRFGVQED